MRGARRGGRECGRGGREGEGVGEVGEGGRGGWEGEDIEPPVRESGRDSSPRP